MSINRCQWLISIVVCLSVIALTTCGKDSPTKPKPPEPPPPPPVSRIATRIEITPSSATLNSIGQTVRLTARVFDQNNNAMSGATVTWSSSNIGVAAVSQQGTVTAVTNGRVVIAARSGNASATANVTVSQSAGSIVIAPEMATLMSIGATVQLTATVLDQNGQPVDGAVVIWQSSDEAVATVSAQGLVTAVKNGVARITARSGTATTGIDVSVMQSAGSIAVEPEMATLMSLGETVQLTATVLDVNGQPVADAVVTWQSSDEAVATVSAQGLVTAVKYGVARVTATSGSASSSVEITIRVPSPDRKTLLALYNATGGSNWTNNTNWLSDRHVEDWYGVNTDENGRVRSLNLGSNGLQGPFPIKLAQLSSLVGLSLDGNRLTGTIPPELGELTSLQLLYLFDNQLSGIIPPDLGQLENLIHLCLNGNQLTGSIPPELGRLTNLKWLHLHKNTSLVGTLPVELVALALDALLLQGTQVCLPDDPRLEQWVSGIPDARIEAECEDFDIERFALKAFYDATDGPNWSSNTNWLSDEPLDQWHGIHTYAGRVISLALRGNRLSGTIPSELWQLTNLQFLELGRNQLSGELPEGISQLQKLWSVTLDSNTLSGRIPSGLANLENLDFITLKGNRLTGSIPAELGKLTNLNVLSLAENQLSGSIPVELGKPVKTEGSESPN